MNADRTKLLARVHILKKECALSDQEYRALLSRNFGAGSSAGLPEEDLRQLIASLEDMVRERPSGNQKKSSKKIWASWYELRGYLPEFKRTTSYLLGIARRNAPSLALADGLLDFDSVTREEADGIIRSLMSAVRYEKTKLSDVPF